MMNIYFPGSVRRDHTADFGWMTPKNVARCVEAYGKGHPELDLKVFEVPQVPGSLRRSRPVRGAAEAGLTTKRYLATLLVIQPEVPAVCLILYLKHGRWQIGKGAEVETAESFVHTDGLQPSALEASDTKPAAAGSTQTSESQFKLIDRRPEPLTRPRQRRTPRTPGTVREGRSVVPGVLRVTLATLAFFRVLTSQASTETPRTVSQPHRTACGTGCFCIRRDRLAAPCSFEPWQTGPGPVRPHSAQYGLSSAVPASSTGTRSAARNAGRSSNEFGIPDAHRKNRVLPYFGLLCASNTGGEPRGRRTLHAQTGARTYAVAPGSASRCPAKEYCILDGLDRRGQRLE